MNSRKLEYIREKQYIEKLPHGEKKDFASKYFLEVNLMVIRATPPPSFNN